MHRLYLANPSLELKFKWWKVVTFFLLLIGVVSFLCGSQCFYNINVPINACLMLLLRSLNLVWLTYASVAVNETLQGKCFIKRHFLVYVRQQTSIGEIIDACGQQKAVCIDYMCDNNHDVLGKLLPFNFHNN